MPPMPLRAFSASNGDLLEEACRRAGLEDFGPADFKEGYDRLLAELDSAGLSPEGASAARELILGNLVGRLRAFDGFRRHPEAMHKPIVRPLIITGIVRSGTTALHKLLSMDPQFQGAEHWLTAAPQPRPPREAWASNPDFQRASAALEAAISVAPEMAEDHGMSVEGVEESLNLLAHSFCSNMYPSQLHIPRYDAWYRSVDDTFSYQYLADALRLIGLGAPGRTWLLKNPTDTFSLRQVLAVFPDAMIVQTHRDPLQAVPSIVNLLAGAQRLFRGEAVDAGMIFAREQELWAEAMDRADTVKAEHPGGCIDVFFNDFVRDQMAVVQRIYDHFGLALSSEAETAMRGWLAANPRRSTTMQRFTPEDYGHSTAALLDRFAGYRQRYDFA